MGSLLQAWNINSIGLPTTIRKCLMHKDRQLRLNGPVYHLVVPNMNICHESVDPMYTSIHNNNQSYTVVLWRIFAFLNPKLCFWHIQWRMFVEKRALFQQILTNIFLQQVPAGSQNI